MTIPLSPMLPLIPWLHDFVKPGYIVAYLIHFNTKWF